jgi:integrase/recombinase XerD
MEILLKDFNSHLLAEKGYSRNTLETYNRYIKRFFKYLKRKKKDALSIDQNDFERFLVTLHGKLSANSRRLVIESCKSFYKFLSRESIINQSPIALVEKPKFWQKLPDVLSYPEIELLLEQPNLETVVGLKNKAMMELLYGSGIRVSELCNLLYHNVDTSQRIIRVNGKGSKERIIPISRSFINAWNEYKQIREDSCFAFTSQFTGKSYSRESVLFQIKNYGKKAGLQKRVYPHILRHSFATHMLERGADLVVIQQLLGHENIATTGIYLHLSTSKIKENFNKYHPRN